MNLEIKRQLRHQKSAFRKIISGCASLSVQARQADQAWLSRQQRTRLRSVTYVQYKQKAWNTNKTSIINFYSFIITAEHRKLKFENTG